MPDSRSTSLIHALSPMRWGLLAASAVTPVDGFEVVRRDLATVGFANVAYAHNLPFADEMRFPAKEKIIGTMIHDAMPVLRRVGLMGGAGYVRVCDLPVTERRADIMRDLGLTSSCVFGAPDRVTRETSVLMANWFEGVVEFERVFPLIREQLALGAYFSAKDWL